MSVYVWQGSIPRLSSDNVHIIEKTWIPFRSVKAPNMTPVRWVLPTNRLTTPIRAVKQLIAVRYRNQPMMPEALGTSVGFGSNKQEGGDQPLAIYQQTHGLAVTQIKRSRFGSGGSPGIHSAGDMPIPPWGIPIVDPGQRQGPPAPGTITGPLATIQDATGGSLSGITSWLSNNPMLAGLIAVGALALLSGSSSSGKTVVVR